MTLTSVLPFAPPDLPSAPFHRALHLTSVDDITVGFLAVWLQLGSVNGEAEK